MGTVLAVLGVLAVLLVAGFVATREGPVLAEAPRDRPDLDLPETGPVTADDLARVRFGMVLRGYRMAEVDDLLDRLAHELRLRDERIAELEAGSPRPRPVSPPVPGPVSPPVPGPVPAAPRLAGPDEPEPSLPPVRERPGAEPPRPVPFPEPVHVDEPERLPAAPDEPGGEGLDPGEAEPEGSGPSYVRRS